MKRIVSIISFLMVFGVQGVNPTQAASLNSAVHGELRSLELLDGIGAKDPSHQRILRDGLWPSQRAQILLGVLEEAQGHGVQFDRISFLQISEIYEAASEAREALKFAINHGASNEEVLVGRAVGAIERVRQVESELVKAASILMRVTEVEGQKYKRKSRARRLKGFLRNPQLKGIFPEHPDYLMLVDGLRRLERLHDQSDWESLSLQERFRALGWGELEDSNSLKIYQEAHHLEPSGVVDGKVEELLNRSMTTHFHLLLETMGRWHRSPLRGESSFIRVNIPAYRAEYWEKGVYQEHFRVVVGDLEGETPEFHREIKAIVLNPSWYVPASVKQRDLDQRQKKDPGFYKNNGFRLIGGGKRVIQKPGEGNWLGRVIFRWDRGGTQSVFIHDSPFQERFDRLVRAMSHGCVNLEGARSLARKLAILRGGISAAGFDRMLKTEKTRRIPLRLSLTTVLEYTTVVPGPEGQLVFLPDVYNRIPPESGDLALRQN